MGGAGGRGPEGADARCLSVYAPLFNELCPGQTADVLSEVTNQQYALGSDPAETVCEVSDLSELVVCAYNRIDLGVNCPMAFRECSSP